MIARESQRLIIPMLIVAILAMFLGKLFDLGILIVISGLALFAMIFTLYFFRDPERIIPPDPALLVAPADGKIVEICDVDDPFVGSGRRIAIFMSLFNVHINRAPYSGVVRQIDHKNGKFHSAFKPEAATENEQCRITMEKDNLKIAVTQIAGFFARRIISRVKVGQNLEKGERLGLIMFGSRVELIIPRTVKINICPGAKVKAGETVIGEM
ncbi:MAG TPA: phosphatidylserine decarboxylase family protein [Candidatus Marinimicrobia bacterium]|nr:phosphatidylserine decarboxylase family protein [Candidatus Neomarinimicrobiota bacterium]HRS51858.1 phosphatidylserine decarboxylase family protein [Candidatus Neomarinimicrobiota bacterium]HRU92681.1 phosphatidylserine decarboxylase family protein [Candidatus Neomarinimicrobiota bacterium]